jgi:hypothetical protein
MIDLKQFLNEEQDPKAIEKIVNKLSAVLMNGEEVGYIAVQKKPAVNLSPDAIALTNKRVIFCRPKNLGLSIEFQDFHWKDVLHCKVKEGILGSEFTMTTTKGQENQIDYLPKTQARKLYAFAQEQEQIQQELNRQIDLETKRAEASNVTVANTPSPTADTAAPQADSDDPMVAALQKLKALFDSGLINQQEFEAKKAEILARI